MLLPERTAAGLGQEGFRFLLHTRVPTNDDVIQLRPGRAGQHSNCAALSLGAGGAESFARKGSRENGSRAGPPNGPLPTGGRTCPRNGGREPIFRSQNGGRAYSASPCARSASPSGPGPSSAALDRRPSAESQRRASADGGCRPLPALRPGRPVNGRPPPGPRRGWR